MNGNNDRRQAGLAALLARYEAGTKNGGDLFLSEEEFDELLIHYYNQQDYDETLSIADLAISQHPYVPDFYKWKALIHKINFQESSAMDALEKLNVYAPNDEEVLLLRLEILTHFEHREEAREIISRLSVSFTTPEKRSLLAFFGGLLSMQEDRYRESFDAMCDAIRLDPYQEGAIDELVNAPELEDFREEARDLLTALTEKDPLNDLLWYYLGLLYDEFLDDRAALEAFDHARSLNPQRAVYDLDYADKLFDLEEFDQAIHAYLAYLAGDEGEESYETCIRLGRSYQLTGMTAAAKEQYFRAVNLDPEQYDIYQYIAECYVTEGRWGVAAYNYGRAVELKGHTSDCWLGLALCSSATNATEEAEAAFRRAIEMEPEYSDAYISFAVFLINLGRETEALELVEAARKEYEDAALLYGATAVAFLCSRRRLGFEYLHDALRDYYEDRDLLLHWDPKLEQDKEVKALLRLYRP